MDVRVDYKESWALKNWCFWTVVLKDTLESSLDCREIQPVNPKGNQSWLFIGRTDAEAETPILWLPDAKNQLTGKDPHVGKDWRQEQKGITEDEMVGWHHWHNEHELEQVLGVGDGQGSLAYCNPWGGKESDTTEGLNWTELRLTWIEVLALALMQIQMTQNEPLLNLFWNLPFLDWASILGIWVNSFSILTSSILGVYHQQVKKSKVFTDRPCFPFLPGGDIHQHF